MAGHGWPAMAMYFIYKQVDWKITKEIQDIRQFDVVDICFVYLRLIPDSSFECSTCKSLMCHMCPFPGESVHIFSVFPNNIHVHLLCKMKQGSVGGKNMKNVCIERGVPFCTSSKVMHRTNFVAWPSLSAWGVLANITFKIHSSNNNIYGKEVGLFLAPLFVRYVSYAQK